MTQLTTPAEALPQSSPKTRQMIVNGSLVPFAKAQIHLMAPAMRYGLNIFEGLRGYWCEQQKELFVFRLEEHMARFDQSMKLLRFAPDFDTASVTKAVTNLLRADGYRENCHIRAVAYLDGMGEHHVTGPVSWFVYAGPRPRSPKTHSGISCHISSWRRMADNALPPRIKCGANYANARLARFQAQQDGYDDAILLNDQGKVAEGPGACLFLMRQGRLITPDVTSGILESITRATLIELARDLGLAVEERAVDRTELYAADEIFLAGSAAEVLPVTALDGLTIGAGDRGPVTCQLQQAYFNSVVGQHPLAQTWLSPVHGAQP
ncbi:branched-chain amino acid transaminase [Rhodovibrionaceae bacterium A322]